MGLADTARDYLGTACVDWPNWAFRVSAEVARAGIAPGAGPQQELLVEDQRVEVELAVMDSLLDPDLVRKVASAPDDVAAARVIAQSIGARLRRLRFEVPVWEESAWDTVVDIDGDGRLVRLYEVCDDESYFEAGALLSIHQSVGGIRLDTRRLTSIVSKTELSTTPPRRESLSIERLSVIDSTLYSLLLKQPELLRTLDWRVFEKLLANILDSLGYEVELQKGTKDGGVDIFAIKRQDPFGPQRFLLQAKRWSNKVGVEPVRQLAFLHTHHRVTKSCLATTATFTRGAWQLGQQYRWQLELRDFDGIMEWVRVAAAMNQANRL